jgi:superfamily II DNA or RNA helicase
MNDLSSLINRLDPDPQVRGKQFEPVAKWFFENSPEYSSKLKKVWHWKDWPGRPDKEPDIGIDLVAQTHDGDYWAIQVKCYAESTTVTKADMDSFLSASSKPQYTYRLLITTTNSIAPNALKAMKGQSIDVGTIIRADLDQAGLDWTKSPKLLAPKKYKRKTLRPHQKKAVKDVVKGFEDNARGQMIMACGTGKTIAALGVHEQLASKRTLVLVPSLSLLKQTLSEWTANAAVPFEFLTVCSDYTVVGDDAAISSTRDLGVPVTTDAKEIAKFLAKRSSRAKIIFSTYQSSPQLAQAYAKKDKPPAFDLIICDEAHRCAGENASAFTTVLDDKKIKSKRRLFMTATPRYFTDRVMKAAQGLKIASMDNEAVFGPEFHCLTFAQAIEQNLLTDYRVIIVGVDDATSKQWAKDGRYVSRDGKKTDARTLAGQIGLAKVVKSYDLTKIISFHSRVKAAQEFSVEFPDVVKWMPSRERPKGEFDCQYVSGDMSARDRKKRLDAMASASEGHIALVANARCLAEGVDVPNLDGVAFVDPRKSEVDIIQAVGRAIRLSPGKEIGTIVLPVFIDTNDDPEQVLNQSVFKPIWDVLKALRSHDAELSQQLDELRRNKGKTGALGSIPNKIIIDLPTSVGVDFAEKFNAQLVDATTESWEWWFGKLEEYVRQNNDALVPDAHKTSDGIALGRWVGTQRANYNRGQLSPKRIALLDSQNFVWDPLEAEWQKNFAALEEYVRENDDSLVPKTHKTSDGIILGRWVGTQRANYNRGQLSPKRIELLKSQKGWSWDPIQAIRGSWEWWFGKLEEYVRENNDALVPQRHKTPDGITLGRWVGKQRTAYNKGKLSKERIELLDSQNFVWDVEEADWQQNFAALEEYVRENNGALVPAIHKTTAGIALGSWVRHQRTNYKQGKLSKERIELLDSQNFVWDKYEVEWQDNFAALEEYVRENNDALVPNAHKTTDGIFLGNWVGKQRTNYKQGQLSKERIALLKSKKGWIWVGLRGRYSGRSKTLRKVVHKSIL